MTLFKTLKEPLCLGDLVALVGHCSSNKPGACSCRVRGHAVLGVAPLFDTSLNSYLGGSSPSTGILVFVSLGQLLWTRGLLSDVISPKECYLLQGGTGPSQFPHHSFCGPSARWPQRVLLLVAIKTTVIPSFTLTKITGLDEPGILSHPRLFLITSVVSLLNLKKKS